ncbi:Peptidase family M28 [Filimonas lacunae]|uniref:Peptidase family M28 n=1 Tax=Filimonas lacunae TaxID=477680 RepID=A0A173MKG2_9BACT|nr:M28 family peptidase [Filimonas lacunae]BAV07888.1 aminopeptidase [Filimonas lacunae]SIT06042.1 Peptidase family M28 [Filimonas lacunae]
MKNKIVALLLAMSLGGCAFAQQDSIFIRQVVDTLTSKWFLGRGYLDNGMGKAADYLQQQFKSFGLQPLKGDSYAQPFSYPVNTFPGNVSLTINGRQLKPGIDYIPAPESRGIKGKGELQQKDGKTFIDAANRVIVVLEKKLTWSVAPEAADYTVMQVDSSLFVNEVPASIAIDLDNKLVSKFKTANIAGMVKGTQYPDSILFITAHYDHLGGLGRDTYFPGANDNASGVGLLLNLARYYATHPQPYSIGFICFAGEEIGLMGSKYYTEHPLLPLNRISFLLNLDLTGTGEEGVTIVNATEYKEAFAKLKSINAEKHYLAAVNERGKAANSDHYFFSEKGVPAFFLYTMGGIKAYHDVFDKAATLPLNEVNDLSSLIKDFFEQLQKK